VTTGSNAYCYDQNGNQRQRTIGGVVYTLTYDAENRLVSVSGAATASFTYDADGNRVKSVLNGETVVYVGNHYEVDNGVVKKYYYAGATRVAENSGGALTYLLSDHLGSQALTLDSSGNRLNTNTEIRYYPYGGLRYSAGSTPTTFNFTGQRRDSGSGLLFYNARYYDPALGRFLQADTIVPEPGNPQALNRYSYSANNPQRYTDPTGHFTDDAIKAYLQGTYSDKWQDYWNTWLADQEWMNLLHDAEGGDVLTRASWSNGTLSLNHVYLAGKGQDLLSGAYELDNLSQNAKQLSSISLADVYSAPYQGMAAFRFANAAGIEVIASIGNIGVFLKTMTREDIRAQSFADWVAITAIGQGISPLIGLILGGAKALGSPEWGELPGRKVGDIKLTIALSADLGETRRVSSYKTILRDGENLGRHSVFDGTRTWDIPRRVDRHY